MARILNALHISSMFMFLGILLYIYTLLPDQVSLYFDTTNSNQWVLDKSDFFNLTLVVFVLTNGMIQLYKAMKRQTMIVPSNDYFEMTFSAQFYHWLTGLSFTFNITFFFSVLFFGMYYNATHFDITDYVAFIYIGPVLIIGWTAWLVYLLAIIKSRASN